MATFETVLIQLDNLGVLDVLLPFILIFAIVFAILQKTKIFGEEKDGKPKKNINTMIALVFGLAVVFPHVLGIYPAGADIVDIINSALPNVSIVLVAIMSFLLIIGMFGGEWKLAGGRVSGWIAALSALLIIYIFGASAGWWGSGYGFPYWLNWLNDPDTQALVLVILVFGVIVYFITAEPSDKPKKEDTLMYEIGEHVKKK